MSLGWTAARALPHVPRWVIGVDLGRCPLLRPGLLRQHPYERGQREADGEPERRFHYAAVLGRRLNLRTKTDALPVMGARTIRALARLIQR